jgi:zinc transport system substrate-binding protein
VPVVASFYPLFEFTQRVGGERVSVRNVVPAGAEPHDYEPTPRDVRAMHAARVLVYNGRGFEPWVQRVLTTLPAALVRVNASDGLPLSTAAAGDYRGRPDPHVWLDPVLAQRQVDAIRAGLARADPAGSPVYEANALAYTRRLASLHDQFARTLAPCRRKVFVVNHAAFGYLAARYGLRQVAISGLEPGAEPSAAKIREILRVIRQHDVRVIYYESLVSPRVANAIAREVGARTLPLNPIEGFTDDEVRQGKSYVTAMEENLRSLVQGLECP